jgi:hypothetical protein
LVVKTFVVVRAFEAYRLPVTFRDVKPGRPAMVWIPDAVTLVVKTFVVVRAFEAKIFPVTLINDVAFMSVSEFAKILVVVIAFGENMLEVH